MGCRMTQWREDTKNEDMEVGMQYISGDAQGKRISCKEDVF